MDKKIYVVGLDDEATESKVNDAVKAVAGVSNCVANSSKAQVLVSFDENTAGIEDAINAAITSITRIRGTLGAAESRLETTIENISSAREQFKSAESRIRDADVAEEAAEMLRLNILEQAGTALLAQANQHPQLVLQLLG